MRARLCSPACASAAPAALAHRAAPARRLRLLRPAVATAARRRPAAAARHTLAAAGQQSPDGLFGSLPAYAAWPATARVALRTGIYILALGLAVAALPGAVFGAAFADASRRVPMGWVRVGGVLAALFGSYYIGAALDDAAGRHPAFFYAATVIGRLLLSAAFALLVATGAVEPGLLVLAAANAASSLLLASAARRRRREEEAAAAQGGSSAG